MYGTIRTAWKIEGDESFILNVTVPGNTKAGVYLSKPTGTSHKWAIREESGICWKNSAFVAGVSGITGAIDDGDYIVVNSGSGVFRFETGIFR